MGVPVNADYAARLDEVAQVLGEHGANPFRVNAYRRAAAVLRGPGTTRDWVILYHDDGAGERQDTVITARHGPMSGRRLVRGREAECARHYGLRH